MIDLELAKDLTKPLLHTFHIPISMCANQCEMTSGWVAEKDWRTLIICVFIIISYMYVELYSFCSVIKFWKARGWFICLFTGTSEDGRRSQSVESRRSKSRPLELTHREKWVHHCSFTRILSFLIGFTLLHLWTMHTLLYSAYSSLLLLLSAVSHIHVAPKFFSYLVWVSIFLMQS